MGRAALRGFLEDLIQFGNEARGVIKRRPGELRVAAAGGTLALGNSGDVLRQLLLYADHVVFENPLPALAERFILSIDQKQTGLKDQIISEIHPHLFQFFAIRPAWERQMSSFAYAAPSNHQDKHPLAGLVKPALLNNIDYSLSTNGSYLMELRIGSNRYIATRDFKAMNPSVTSAGPPYATSTREMNRLSGRFQMFTDGQPVTIEQRGDLTSLLDDSNPAANSLDEFVSFEIERLERLSRICLGAGASYVTDEPADWCIVRSLPAVDQTAAPLREEDVPSFVFDLSSELSFLEGISLGELLSLRDDLTDEFLRFRGAVLEMGRSRAGNDPALWRREAQRLVHEDVEPALAALSQAIQRNAKKHLNTSLAALIAAAVSGMVAWVSHSALPLLASLTFLSKVLESADEYETTLEDPMFFLLQVRGAGDERRG